MSSSLTWMSTDAFLKRESENPIKLKLFGRDIPRIQKTIDSFHQKYPTPEFWLQNSKEPLENETIEYILVWFLENEFISTTDKIKIFNILFESYTHYKRTIRWAYYYNFITKEQFQEILNAFPTMKRGITKFLYHLFYFKKPFGSLTKSECGDFFNIFNKVRLKPYTNKILSKILFHFGYDNSVQFGAKRSPNKEQLINHPIYGKAFLDYDLFLNANGTPPKSIRKRFSPLKKFIEYLDQKGYKDASEINQETLSDYIENELNSGIKESSIATTFPKIQHFLDWTLGSYDFFPKEINYPDDILSKIRKKAREYREETDGLAFTDDRFPGLTVAFLKQFEPTNEIEYLSSRFWTIIASCATRQGFVLNLEYNNCMYPLLNEKSIYGLYSQDTDKAKNKNGHFPIIDEIGVKAIQELEERIKSKSDSFKPIKNPESDRVFIHLFQFENSNQVLDRNHVSSFQKDYIAPYIAQKLNITNVDSISFGTHAFRHYLLTHIVKKTGDEETAQAAAGHHDGKMIRGHYIKSKFAKKALLHRAIEKYESGEITGKFYLRLIEKLTNETEFNSELMKDLETEMNLEEFIKKHGRATQMGYCFDENHTCNHYMKCWNCPSFMMRREEITGAINLLRKLINDHLNMRSYSKGFSYENTLVQNNLRAIAMIKERLSDLKYTDEQIETMLYSENI